MRVAVVTQWFPPEPGTLAAAAIVDGLAGRGHQVDVVTGFPNYPTGTLIDGYTLKPYLRERRSTNVTVHRAPLYPSHNRSAPHRAANYLSFALSAWTLSQTRLTRPDAWLIYSSPATTAIAALLSRTGMRAPTYLLIQDLWPDSVTESGFLSRRLSTGVGRALTHYCDWTYRRAAGIGVISPGMKSILVERGVLPSKIHLTPNWMPGGGTPTRAEKSLLRRNLGLPAGRLFMYAGNMGDLQGLDNLVEGFCDVPEAKLVLVGGGVRQTALAQLVRERGARNVTFHGAQSVEKIGDYIAASDVQLVSLKDTPLLRATCPSKVQSSLAANRPILAHAAGDVADVVSASGSGVSCRPGDRFGAVRAIERFLEMSETELERMGQKAGETYRSNFAPDIGAERLEAMLLGRASAHDEVSRAGA